LPSCGLDWLAAADGERNHSAREKNGAPQSHCQSRSSTESYKCEPGTAVAQNFSP
jgi:hypothetical protein